MKFTTIYLGDNKIEIFNSLIGKERITVNGEEVSSKFSITGAEHHFEISENGENSQCKIITGLGANGVVIDFYKDDKPIIESPKSGCFGFFLMILVIVFLIDLIVRLF